MKMNQLRERLRKDRPMTTISIRMPEDLLGDLKRVAPRLGFSGYQPLIRAYIGQGLRQDLERLEQRPDMEGFVESLRRHGVAEAVISQALDETAYLLSSPRNAERLREAISDLERT